MTGPTTQQRVDVEAFSIKARQVAEELGYGPTGDKEGGIIMVVVDHVDGNAFVAHAGDATPLYSALLFAINALVSKAAEMCGGERVLSSVQKWRARTKGSRS